MVTRASATIATPGEGIDDRLVLLRQPLIWRGMVHHVDVSGDRRTAESVLDIEADEIPGVITGLARAKRLSVVMRNLNRLLLHAADRELGRRALRHLGFLAD